MAVTTILVDGAETPIHRAATSELEKVYHAESAQAEIYHTAALELLDGNAVAQARAEASWSAARASKALTREIFVELQRRR
jgi:hypothetical protein